MSDISQPTAPPPSAPAPSAPPPQQDVPVNEAPVSAPTPLGDQAPPKPPGQDSDKSSRMGRREAIQNAFARAKQAQEDAGKEVPKRARPGMGHNQPPEEMAKEPPKAEAKKPETQAERAQRYREGGRFARDPAKAADSQPGMAENGREVPSDIPASQQQKPQQLDKNAPYRQPPGRFSEPAQADWHATPESVRGAVDKMSRDFQGFYERARGDYEVMQELRPYHEMAVKQGTSLRRAVDNYYGMEQKLRGDLVGGLDVIVQNMRMKHGDGSPVTLHDVAHHIVNMTPEQHQLTAQRNQQTSADMRIGQLHQTVERQSQILDQMMYQQKFAGTRAEVDRFAQAHPRFDELADLIKTELDHGYPLEVAYQRADKLRPNTAPQTRNTPAQTRKTSISGAPDGGNNKPANTRPSDGQRRNNGEAKHPTRREAIAKAIRRVGNGV